MHGGEYSIYKGNNFKLRLLHFKLLADNNIN